MTVRGWSRQCRDLSQNNQKNILVVLRPVATSRKTTKKLFCERLRPLAKQPKVVLREVATSCKTTKNCFATGRDTVATNHEMNNHERYVRAKYRNTACNRPWPTSGLGSRLIATHLAATYPGTCAPWLVHCVDGRDRLQSLAPQTSSFCASDCDRQMDTLRWN